MPDPTVDRLAEIEQRIAALDDPPALMQAIEAGTDLANAPGERGVRYQIARGIVQNRNSIPGSAQLTFERARAAADIAGAEELLPIISRELARVHAWRGDAKSAALELLRSMIEADATGSAVDKALAVAEFGRLNLEAGRYEAALTMLDRAIEQAALLPPREQARLAINRREALAALGRWDECLEGIDEAVAGINPEFRRDNFVIRLVKARGLDALGRTQDAAAAAEDARRYVAKDPQSFEQAELALLDGLLMREARPEEAVVVLERALERFADDDLPRHEFGTRILLAQTLAALGRQADAETCIAEALRRAEARQLPAMADRVRAAAFGFWRAENITELSADDAASPGGRDRHGRFLVMETLGDGGFGSVQRAIERSATGTEVAIKRLKRDVSANPGAAKLAVGTVRNEILAAAALLPGRSVARTRYLHIDEDGIVLVQDFVSGSTLRSALNEGVLTLGRRLSIAASVARTVATLHTAKLAHRDLKPDNIILRNGTQPVIIDLGLARLKGVVDVTAGAGTEGYAPKEQWTAGGDDRWLGREDVYALGRIIEEMIAAVAPTSEPRRGWFGRSSGRRSGGVLVGALGTTVERMLVEDVAKRDVDLKALADLLDQAARDADLAGAAD